MDFSELNLPSRTPEEIEEQRIRNKDLILNQDPNSNTFYGKLFWIEFEPVIDGELKSKLKEVTVLFYKKDYDVIQKLGGNLDKKQIEDLIEKYEVKL